MLTDVELRKMFMRWNRRCVYLTWNRDGSRIA